MKLNLNRNQFTQALQRYDAAGLLTGETRDVLEWFWGFAASELDMDKQKVAAALGYDATTVYNLLAGNRTASLSEPVARIQQLRKRVAGRVSRLIETPVTRRIYEACEYARNTNSMVVIRGETGRGKTYACREWARANNHGRTVYLRAPSNCTRAKLVRAIAQATGIGISGKKTASLEAQLWSSYDRRRTLIVDEVGHLVPTHGRNARDMLDLIRDVHDMCDSGVVLIFTSVYWDEITQGRMAPFFEQFIGRVRYNLHIPEGTLFVDEVQAILAAHGFEEDTLPTAVEIAREEGKLRTLFGDLANARVYAERTETALSTTVLKKARAWRRSGGAWNEEIA